MLHTRSYGQATRQTLLRAKLLARSYGLAKRDALEAKLLAQSYELATLEKQARHRQHAD